jgi:hypothetical protein
MINYKNRILDKNKEILNKLRKIKKGVTHQ